MSSSDPYYIVRDEVGETVSVGAARAARRRPPPWRRRSNSLPPLPPQLHGVQAKFGKWQGMLRSSAEGKTLQRELEEDCQSLEYMVGAAGGGSGLC